MIKLDTRGNENGINAQFSVDNEMLAYSFNEEKGEFDFPIVYVEPNRKVIEIIENSNNLNEAIQKVISVNWPRNNVHIGL